MKTTKIIFYIVIYTFILYCILYSLYTSIYEKELTSEHTKEQHEELKSVILNDVVDKKFIDIHNHSFRIILFVNKKRFSLLNSDTLGFYNYILPQDSIIKVKDSDTIKVFRSGIVKKFKLERGYIE